MLYYYNMRYLLLLLVIIFPVYPTEVIIMDYSDLEYGIDVYPSNDTYDPCYYPKNEPWNNPYLD